MSNSYNSVKRHLPPNLINRNLERRQDGWWRRWRGPWGVEIVNVTKYPAKVQIIPYLHRGPANAINFNLGIGGAAAGGGVNNDIYGEELGNCLYLEARGIQAHNRELVRIENKLYYVRVYLKTDKWICVIPSKLLSSHYNYFIREDYERMLHFEV